MPQAGRLPVAVTIRYMDPVMEEGRLYSGAPERLLS